MPSINSVYFVPTSRGRGPRIVLLFSLVHAAGEVPPRFTGRSNGISLHCLSTLSILLWYVHAESMLPAAGLAQVVAGWWGDKASAKKGPRSQRGVDQWTDLHETDLSKVEVM